MSGGVGGGSREVSPYPDSNIRVLVTMNEILRRVAPQNDVVKETVISSAARNPYDDSLKDSSC